MSNTYPTSDIPLGSTLPKVLYNNASNFDDAMNLLGPAWTDRFNRRRQTFYGMEVAFQDFLTNSGYQYVGADYVDGVPGLTFSARNQYTVRAGVAYRLSETAPMPYITTGVWATDQANFIAFDLNSNLAQNLANDTDLVKGAALVGYKGRTVAERLGDVVSVLDFGADPTGVSDSIAAFNAARDYLQTGGDFTGGTILIPKGYYKLSNTWTFTADASGVHNITIEGAGILSSTLDFTTAPASTDGIAFTGPGAHVVVKGFMIKSARRIGLSFATCHEISVQEMRIQNCLSHGLSFNDTFMCSLSDLWLTTNTGNGLNFQQKHTSITAYRVYTNDNTGIGIAINGMTYSSFVSCGSDNNSKGYSVSNVRGLTFLSCGCEANLTDGWYVFSSNASQGTLPVEFRYVHGLELIGCVAYFNSMSAAGVFGNFITVIANDANPIQLSMRGCGSARQNVADYSVILSGASGPISYTDKDADHNGKYSITGDVTVSGYLESIVPSGASTSLTTNVTKGVTSIALPGGDWEVDATGLFTPNGSTSVAGYVVGISTVNNALPGEQDYMTAGAGFSRVSATTFNLRSPAVRVRSDALTTVYLVVQATFSAGPLVACGKLTARKL